MFKKLLLSIICLILFIATPANAADSDNFLWLYSSDTRTYLLDKTSLKIYTKNNMFYLDVWIKAISSNDAKRIEVEKMQALGYSGNDVKPVAFLLSNHIFSYNKGYTVKKLEVVNLNAYDDQGVWLFEIASPTKGEIKIIPGTTGAELLMAVLLYTATLSPDEMNILKEPPTKTAPVSKNRVIVH